MRAGSWRFATSLLDQASYQHLLELMLSPTTVVEARATYGRADGQGTFVTVWGRHCTVSHVFSQFDARGIHGREAGWTLYFTLAAEEMGREAGTAGAFVMPAARSYAVTPPASVAGPVTRATAAGKGSTKPALDALSNKLTAPALELRSGGLAAVTAAVRQAIGGSSAAGDQPRAAFAASNAASATADATVSAVTDTAAVGAIAATAAAIALDAATVSSNLEKIQLKALPKSMNPGNGLSNCTHIVVAAVARLRGTDPEAIAPADGKMREIPEVEELLGVRFDLDSYTDFHKSFREIESMSEGTIGVLLMLPKAPGGTGHIVTVVNNKGVATIIEAQHQNLLSPAELITSSTRAARRYGDEDQTRVFLAILPPPPTPA